MNVRLEASDDQAEIYPIYGEAFGQLAEADLVQRLRADGDLVLSLTAYAEGPVGHIAFSRLGLDETPHVKGCVLAPVAIVPAWQRKGVGSTLIREGLKRLSDAGFDLAVVLGDPAYYGRFGFSAEQARRLRTPYDGPYLQALSLSGTGNEARGLVSYARAFAELE